MKSMVDSTFSYVLHGVHASTETNIVSLCSSVSFICSLFGAVQVCVVKQLPSGADEPKL